MKQTVALQTAFRCIRRLLAFSLIVAPFSCRRLQPEDITGGEGTIRLHFQSYSYDQTRASGSVPDTSDFLLKVTDSGGKVIFDGKYGDSPEKLKLSAGTYDISVRSGAFTRPAFSAPLYGDDQCAVVKSGAVSDIYLACEQVNAGIRLKIAPDFLKSYPDGVLFLKSTDGKLMYGYAEKRIAYFSPGGVSLVLNDSGSEKTLFTKTLKAKQVLTVSISAPSSSSQSSTGGRLHVSVDTSRVWVNDRYVIGSGSGGFSSGGSASGNTYKTAYNVTQAKSEIGAEDVWVYGYIVGGDMTSASISFDDPFTSDTNLAIAGRTTVTEKESCFSVQLPKGPVREALNLVDNPENLKRKVYLKGDIVESYYGIPGLRNVSDYVLE